MNKPDTQTNVFSIAASESAKGNGLSNPDDVVEWLSALADGELDEGQVEQLLANDSLDDTLSAKWASYHVIGDALRGQTDALFATESGALLAAVRGHMTLPDEVALPTSGRASVEQEGFAVESVGVHSANDANFRWKMTAAVASMAAVLAVGWNVMSVMTESEAVQQPGVTMAERLLAPSVGNVAAPVLVKTEIGAMIRDPELERLLSEHRSYGGVSSLQMPAGFLRSATQEAPRQSQGQ